MRVLFVCRENTCRSVMAETVFRKRAEGRHEAFSAGVNAGRKFDENAILTLKRKGYSPEIRKPARLDEISLDDFDVVVSVCQESECILINHPNVERWNIDDPKNKGEDEYLRVLEIIEARADDLLRRIGDEGS